MVWVPGRWGDVFGGGVLLGLGSGSAGEVRCLPQSSLNNFCDLIITADV